MHDRSISLFVAPVMLCVFSLVGPPGSEILQYTAVGVGIGAGLAVVLKQLGASWLEIATARDGAAKSLEFLRKHNSELKAANEELKTVIVALEVKVGVERDNADRYRDHLEQISLRVLRERGTPEERCEAETETNP